MDQDVLTMTSKCPGNPEGHVWHLHKEQAEYEHVYPRWRRTGLWRKLFGEWKESSPWDSLCFLVGWHRKWACSNCRLVEWDYEENTKQLEEYIKTHKKYEYDV